jgi:hypothetical protein
MRSMCSKHQGASDSTVRGYTFYQGLPTHEDGVNSCIAGTYAAIGSGEPISHPDRVIADASNALNS